MNRLMKNWINPALSIAGVLLALTMGANVLAQADVASVLENIRPVGQVCITGQDCTGSMGNAPSAVPVVESVPAQVTVTETVATPAAFDAAATYQMSCFACHATGAAGAPITGDSAAWEARMAKGMDTVLANAMNGLNAMPAKGMCMTCSESDMRLLVEYMMNPN